jgi:hypothetical protein
MSQKDRKDYKNGRKILLSQQPISCSGEDLMASYGVIPFERVLAGYIQRHAEPMENALKKRGIRVVGVADTSSLSPNTEVSEEKES